MAGPRRAGRHLRLWLLLLAATGAFAACQPALEVPVRNDAAEPAVLELTTLSANPRALADPIVLDPGEATVVHIDPQVADWSLRVDGGKGWFHSPNLREYVDRPNFVLVITERKELVGEWSN